MKKLYFALLLPLFLNAQTQVGGDIYPEVTYEQSGWCTAISGDGKTVVAGGQPMIDDDYVLRFARARVYTQNGDEWVQKGQSLELTEFYNNVYSRCRVAISTDGNIVAIGNEYTGVNSNLGMVKVFEYNNGAWQQKGQDIIGQENDNLGSEISLSADGTIMAVVAQGDSNYNNVGSYGYVVTYQFTESGWQQRGQKIMGHYEFTEDIFSITDMFQGSVSLSDDGNKMVIGCASTSGNVKIFEFNGTSWQPSAELEPIIDNVGSYGWDVTISGDGNTVAASDIGWETGGSVKLFQQVDGQWVQKGNTIISDENLDSSRDMFGESLSLSDNGNVLAVGAPERNVPQYHEGRAKVYVFNGSNWSQAGVNMDGQSSNYYFGYDVSLSGTGEFLAVASPFAGYYPYYECGVVKVYGLADILSSNDFTQQQFSVYPNPAHETINISLEEGMVLTQVNVYNVLGQCVKTVKGTSIDVSALPAGIYYIEAITTNDKAVKAIIKE